LLDEATSALDNLSQAVVLEGLARLAPALGAPLVGGLAHGDLDVSGEVFAVGGGRVARIFIGESPGFYSEALTAEDVRDHWDQIRDTEGYAIPANLAEETALFLPYFK